jgi:hypothetical protein
MRSSRRQWWRSCALSQKQTLPLMTWWVYRARKYQIKRLMNSQNSRGE